MVRMEIIKNENLGFFNPYNAVLCGSNLVSTDAQNCWIFSPDKEQSYHYGISIPGDYWGPDYLLHYKTPFNMEWWRKVRERITDRVVLSENRFHESFFSSPKIEYLGVEYLGYHRFVELPCPGDYSVYFSSNEKYTIMMFPNPKAVKMLSLIYPSFIAQPKIFTDYQASTLLERKELKMEEVFPPNI